MERNFLDIGVTKLIYKHDNLFYRLLYKIGIKPKFVFVDDYNSNVISELLYKCCYEDWQCFREVYVGDYRKLEKDGVKSFVSLLRSKYR